MNAQLRGGKVDPNLVASSRRRDIPSPTWFESAEPFNRPSRTVLGAVTRHLTPHNLSPLSLCRLASPGVTSPLYPCGGPKCSAPGSADTRVLSRFSSGGNQGSRLEPWGIGRAPGFTWPQTCILDISTSRPSSIAVTGECGDGSVL